MVCFAWMLAEGLRDERQGRYYAVYDVIASGGMATVHLGLLAGVEGFARHVALKRLHPQYATDSEFAAMFANEARLAARISHANVVAMLDVVTADRELLLVMEYVHGESLSRLVRVAHEAETAVPIPVTIGIVADTLHGLHAAHEATAESGAPLGIVHRDVSPQNVLVGADGIARVVDFGIAKAVGSAQNTREGHLKGKMPYMAPEQLLRRPIDRRVDVYAAGVLLWEMLTGRRLFHGGDDAVIFGRVLEDFVAPPSSVDGRIPRALDEITLRALSRDREKRFSSAREMALALEAVCARASPPVVGAWVVGLAGETLRIRAEQIARIDASQDSAHPASPPIELSLSAAVAVRFPRGDVAASRVRLVPTGNDASTSVSPLAPPSASRAGPRNKLALALAVALCLGAVAFAAMGRKQDPRLVDRSAATAPSAPLAQPPAISPIPDVPPAAHPPLSPMTSAMTTPPPARTVASPAPARVQWCKVYDAAQHVFVLQQMRVAQCP